MMEQLLQKITQLYNLELIQDYKPIDAGVGSQNHLLQTATRKYFLKSYRKAEEEKIKTVHKAINYFYEKGIPSIPPIKHRYGSDYFILENSIYALFPFESGNTIQRQSLSLAQSKSLGEMLAKIHLTTKNVIPADFETLVKPKKDLDTRRNKAEAIKQTILNKPNKDSFDEYVLKLIELKVNLLNQHWEEYSKIDLPINALIHGDFHCQNVLFEGDEVKHILDFDNVLQGSRENELVRSMYLTFFEFDFAEESFEPAITYLDIYNKLYPVSSESFLAANKFYYFGLFRTVWAEEWYYNNGNLRVKPILEYWYEKLMYLQANFETLNARLGNSFKG